MVSWMVDMGRWLKVFQARKQTVGMPGTVENSHHIHGMVILSVENRMRETLDTVPSQRINYQWINVRLFCDGSEGGIHGSKQYLTKT